MKKALVLGCGLVGRTIAEELSREFEVTVLDSREENLKRLSNGIKKIKGSALEKDLLKELSKDADVVCGALPGNIGYEVAQRVIQLGKNYCDISFMPEDFLGLDNLAKENEVTAVFDMGVAPGLSNLLVGRGASSLEEIDEVRIYVGGLPEKPEPPFSYKAVFSPYDVLEEYTRPARIIMDGEEKTVEALSGLENIEFSGIGTLEAFYTDGLRSMLKTIRAKKMEEKTIRYPGHANIMKALIRMGLLDKEYIDLIAKLLFPLWELKPEEGDRDITLMMVKVEGKRGSERVTFLWEIFDRFDEESFTHSMARVTAFPCVVVARMIANGEIREKGAIPPESLGKSEEIYNRILKELREKGISIKERIVIERGG